MRSRSTARSRLGSAGPVADRLDGPGGGLACCVDSTRCVIETTRWDRNDRLISSGGACPNFSSTGSGAARSGASEREIRCPADGSLVATVDEAGRRRHRRRDRGRPPCLRQRRVAADLGARPQRAAAPGRRPAGREQGRGGPGRVARHRQATGRERVRRRRHRRRLPLLRQHRRRGRRPRRRHRPGRRAQPDRARADRRLRPDHALELPAAADLVEGRARRWPPATRSCSSRAS